MLEEQLPKKMNFIREKRSKEEFDPFRPHDQLWHRFQQEIRQLSNDHTESKCYKTTTYTKTHIHYIL